MATVSTSARLTYADYRLLPEDGRRHEIIHGEHFVTAPPDLRHQRISISLVLLVGPQARASGGHLLAAPLDVVLSEHDVVLPDLVYVSRENAGIIAEADLQGPPDLVVEIASEPTRHQDVSLKRSLYERSGVLEYWIVDPETEQVTVHRRRRDLLLREADLSREAGDSLESPLLPGLSISLREIFE